MKAVPQLRQRGGGDAGQRQGLRRAAPGPTQVLSPPGGGRHRLKEFPRLLSAALDEEKTELAVRMAYWGPDGGTRVEDAMLRLREERELTETTPWVVNYYPNAENPGLVEFLLDPPEDPGEEAPPTDGEAFLTDGEEILTDGGMPLPESASETGKDGGESSDPPESLGEDAGAPEEPSQDPPEEASSGAPQAEEPET